MEVTWLGHSCFVIAGSRARIVADPYPPDIGLALGRPTADIVTLSHRHPSHSYVQGVGGKPKVIAGPGEYEIGDVLITGIASFHDAEQGKIKGKNTIYLFEIDEIKVCHLGDLGQILTSKQLEDIGGVDVLLVPVGGVVTINAARAAEIVRQLEPRMVIPMHFREAAGAGMYGDLQPLERFLTEVGVKGCEAVPKLNIGKAGLPAAMQFVVLKCLGCVPTAGASATPQPAAPPPPPAGQ